MGRVNQATTSRPAQSANVPSALRIRFISEPSPNARVIQRFSDPAMIMAIAEPVEFSEHSGAPAWPEPTDELLVVHVLDIESSAVTANWLTPANCEAPVAVGIQLEKGRLHWRPGRVLIEGRAVLSDELLRALADFAFHEGQLRDSEAALPSIESAAPRDSAYAYVIRSKDRIHWDRFHETMHRLSTVRLRAAKLEPRLLLRPLEFSHPAQRLFIRLCAKADVDGRLEALSNRLEACEDLYEGAVDRITDHRWYRRGFWVELAIVALLVLEVLQLAASLMLHGPAGK